MPATPPKDRPPVPLLERQLPTLPPGLASVLLGTIVGALGGLILGSGELIGPPVLYGIAKALRVHVDEADMMWFGPVLGAVVGTVFTLVRNFQRGGSGPAPGTIPGRMQRELAKQLGMTFAATPDEDMTALLNRDCPYIVLAMTDVILAEAHGMRILVGDALYRQDPEVTTSPWRTTAYCVSAAARFPAFSVRRHIPGMRFITQAEGITLVAFPDHPEFTAHYDVIAPLEPERVFQFFNGRLAETLGARPGLGVESTPQSLTFSRFGRAGSRGELRDMITETMLILRVIEQSAPAVEPAVVVAEAAPAAPVAANAAPLAPLVAATATPRVAAVPHAVAAKARRPAAMGQDLERVAAERLWGRFGNKVSQSVVTHQELEAFLEEPRPRTVPPGIARWADDRAPAVFLYVGLALTAGGLLFMLVSLTGAPGGGGQIPFGFPAGIFALGTAAAGITWFFRRRVWGILETGAVADGTIISVDRTNVQTNGAWDFRVTVRFDAAGAERTAACTIQRRDAVARAQRFSEAGTPVRVLWAGMDVEHIVWVEGLLTTLPEFDT